jgi:hypothetical protein
MNKGVAILVGCGIVVALCQAALRRNDSPASMPGPFIETATESGRSVPGWDWCGTWAQVNGEAVIRFRHDGRLKADFSPDGASIIPVVPQLRGEAVTFKARFKGRTWSLWLTRTGASARLAGVQEVEPRSGPVVIAPGRTAEERAEEVALRKAEARAVLMPSDLGTFERVQ